MSGPWAWIVKWVRSKNISSHTIAVAMIGLAGAFTGDENFRNVVIKQLAGHPDFVIYLTTAAGLYLKYSVSHSATGILAQVPGAVAQLNADNGAGQKG